MEIEVNNLEIFKEFKKYLESGVEIPSSIYLPIADIEEEAIDA